MVERNSFHETFARVLQGPRRADDVRTIALHDRGISVHRNTIVKALLDALADNYPTVERLVGKEWFAASAAEFAQRHPPAVPMLALYGGGFADFLAKLPAAEQFPYISDVARIDRMWTESYFAADASTLAGDALARLTQTELFEQRLAPHPALRVGWFSHSAVTIWLHNRPPATMSAELEVAGTAEGALVTRLGNTVDCIPLDAAGFAFVTRVIGGIPLGAAATAVLETYQGADIASLLARFISAGAFSPLRNSPPEGSHE